MASGYCSVCGKYCENILYLMGNTCSNQCHEVLLKREREAYLEKQRAEQDRKDQITRERIQTAASVASAAMIAKQTALMEQQQRQAQAQARAEAVAAAQEEAQRQAEQLAAYNSVAQKYGFRDASHAMKYIKGLKENEIVTEEVIKKAAERRETEAQIEKAQNEKFDSEKKFILNLMNEEQKKRNFQISEISKWFENEELQLFLGILIQIISLVLGIFLYIRFKYIFRRFGFFTTFFTFGAAGAIVAKRLLLFIAKSKMKKIKAIKGDDNFPFYIISDFQLFADAFSLFGNAPKIWSILAVFFWALKIPMLLYLMGIKISFAICRLVIILLFIAYIIKTIYSKYMAKKQNAIIVDGCRFDDSYETSYDKGYIGQYKIIKMAHQIIGPFLTDDLIGKRSVSRLKGAFNTWRHGGQMKYWWEYTFLPEKPDQDFNEKWSHLTKEGQVKSWEEARIRGGHCETKNEYKSQEQERFHQELRKEYEMYFSPGGKVDQSYESYKQQVIKKTGYFDDKIKKKFDKIVSDRRVTDPDKKKIRNEEDLRKEKYYYDIRYNYIRGELGMIVCKIK